MNPQITIPLTLRYFRSVIFEKNDSYDVRMFSYVIWFVFIKRLVHRYRRNSRSGIKCILFATYFFSILFTLINIPFYILAYFKMGKKFTFSTILAVSLVTLFSSLLPIILPSIAFYPLLGSIMGGFIIGIGTIILFMNGSSLGGAQILSITLQKQFNWNMGKTNFIFDTIVILIGLYSVGIVRGLYSIVSVFIISFMMSTFKEKIAHRNTVKGSVETSTVVETHSV